MTILAWIFMITSVSFVTGLLVWCYHKVLTAPPGDDIAKPPDSLGG